MYCRRLLHTISTSNMYRRCRLAPELMGRIHTHAQRLTLTVERKHTHTLDHINDGLVRDDVYAARNRYFLRKKAPGQIDHRIKNVRFIGELVKFRVSE